MSEIKIGIVTDSHMCEFDEQIVEALKQENLDAAAYLGNAPFDINAHDEEQFGHIAVTLQRYNKTGIPFFWIPGNYESVPAYDTAFDRCEEIFDNINDAVRLGKYTFKKNGIEVDFVFVPGAERSSQGFLVDPRFKTGGHMVQDSPIYVYNPFDLRKLVDNPEKTIVFAHEPIRMEGDQTFDTAICADYQGEEYFGPGAHNLIAEGKAEPRRVNVGNELLAKLVDDLGVKKFLAGNVYEAAYVTDRQGNPIENGTFSRELFGNPGSAALGNYGVLVYRDDGMAALHSKSVEDRLEKRVVTE